MPDNRIAVTRRINAPASTIYAIVSSPAAVSSRLSELATSLASSCAYTMMQSVRVSAKY